MPIAAATAGTLDQVVAELERDGCEVVQLLTVDDGVKVLYRVRGWETRRAHDLMSFSVPKKAEA